MKRNLVSTLGLILLCLMLALPAAASPTPTPAPEFGQGYATPTPAPEFGQGYEMDLDLEGSLSLRAPGETAWTQLTTDVLAAQLHVGHVYYLQALDAGTQVMDYDIQSATEQELEHFEEPMVPTLAAGDRLYLMDAAGTIYALAFDGSQEPEEMGRVNAADVMLLAFEEGALRAYDMTDETKPKLLATYQIGEISEPTIDAPADDAELARGARGDRVEAVQQALKDLGYPVGSVDGVYGGGTETAVRYLQSDMKLAETGKVDAALERTILDGNAPKYEAYVQLKRGDSGIRVRNLQSRLRALYYTKLPVDGSYGPDTAEAVKRFESAIGSKQSGDAITATQLASLFKKSAPECKTYYELRKDDNAPVVLRLNNRLKKLGYLSGKTSEAYDKHTVRAIKDFQTQAGRKATGVADAKTQKLLFAKDAPGPEPTPTPGPGEQVVNSSTIKTLRSWLKANLGLDYDKTQAVGYLQDKLTETGYLTVPKTSVYDGDTKAAVSAFQKANGIKANGLVNKATLQKMFAVG